ELPANERQLLEEALAASARAVAPYSSFRVGAAVRLRESGEVVSSANVESEVYPAGICAERNLLFTVAANYAGAIIEEMAVASPSSSGECYPCGICRQTLIDTERRQGSPIRVIMGSTQSATVVESAESLLPFTFKLEN
ncbi:MAG: cytidine deaminase, partial [Rikenellaceae bacterium]